MLFERLAHRMLQKGGTFQCRGLDGGKDIQMALGISPRTFMFNKIECATQAADGDYAMPRAQNLAAIDALVQAGRTLS